MRHKLLLACGAVLLALGGLELFCRLSVQPPQSIRFQQDVNELSVLGLGRLASVIRNDDELFWRFVPNQQLPRGLGPFWGIISNGQGLREDHEIALTKEDHELRVLFLGDSCTFGYGLDHTQSFVQLSEELLQQQLRDARIECINSGVPGYSLFQGWRFLETQGLHYRPDVIVACFGWNDLSMWDNHSDLEHYAAARAARPPALFAWSRLYQQVQGVGAFRSASSSQPRPRLLPAEFDALLEKVHLCAKNCSAQLVLLVWGFQFQAEPANARPTFLQTEQYSFAEKNGVPLINLVPVIQQLSRQHGANAVFLDEGHTTALANQEVARLLARQLEPMLRSDASPPSAKVD